MKFSLVNHHEINRGEVFQQRLIVNEINPTDDSNFSKFGITCFTNSSKTSMQIELLNVKPKKIIASSLEK